jgi:hypothetical protein
LHIGYSAHMGPWPPVPPVPALPAVPPLPFDPLVLMIPPVAPVLAPAAPLGLLRPPAPPMLAAPAPPGAIVPPVPLAVSLLLACPPLVAPASGAVLFRPELLQASPSRPATRMATTGVDFLNICFSVCSPAERQVQSTRLTMAAIESAIFPQIAAGTSDLDHSHQWVCLPAMLVASPLPCGHGAEPKDDRFTFAAAVLAANSASRHPISGDHGTRPPTVPATLQRNSRKRQAPSSRGVRGRCSSAPGQGAGCHCGRVSACWSRNKRSALCIVLDPDGRPVARENLCTQD